MSQFNHGGDLSEIQKIYPKVVKPWIDLSTGINPNPFPWQTCVPMEQLLVAANKLPQQIDIQDCKLNWVNYLKAQNSEDWFLVAGSQAFINIAPRLFPKHHCVLSSPSYNEHERVWKQADRNIQHLEHKNVSSFKFEPDTILIITNPNNPDGHVWPPEDLLQIARQLSKNNGILIVDEAFADLCPDVSLADQILPDNVIIMRSFGKFFGLAGLRLGIVRAPKLMKDLANQEIGPWTINAISLQIAKYAFMDKNWIKNTLDELSVKRKRLERILTQNNFQIIGGTELFLLTERNDIRAMNDKLNQNGIYARTFQKNEKLMRFGLPKNENEFNRLKEALS